MSDFNLDLINQDNLRKAFSWVGHPDDKYIEETLKFANKLVFELVEAVADRAEDIRNAPKYDSEDGEAHAEMWEQDQLEALDVEDLRERARGLLGMGGGFLN